MKTTFQILYTEIASWYHSLFRFTGAPERGLCGRASNIKATSNRTSTMDQLCSNRGKCDRVKLSNTVFVCVCKGFMALAIFAKYSGSSFSVLRASVLDGRDKRAVFVNNCVYHSCMRHCAS